VKLSQNLSLHPEQKPLLTRELVQAIHLLQFPAGKLMAFIEEWTRDNPFVEVETVIEEPADSTRLQRNLRHSSHSEPFLRTAFPSMEEYLRDKSFTFPSNRRRKLFLPITSGIWMNMVF